MAQNAQCPGCKSEIEFMLDRIGRTLERCGCRADWHGHEPTERLKPYVPKPKRKKPSKAKAASSGPQPRPRGPAISIGWRSI